MATPPRAVRELLLLGADVGVLNRATLSLWHFQQLLQALMPAEDADSPDDKENSSAPDAALRVRTAEERAGVELGEGMGVAALAFEDGAAVGATGGALALAHAAMTPSAEVAAVYRRYRCVLCLDTSPSTLAIDPATGRVFLDLLYESIELFVWSLLRPMEVGGESFVPELFMSVIAQGALVERLSVVIQGSVVTANSAPGFLDLVRERLRMIEDDWAATAREQDTSSDAGSSRASLAWMLQTGAFAVNSLPSDGAPIIAVMTDGVVDSQDVYSYDNLLMQLVRHDIQCHFLRIGSGIDDPNASFGYVPDTLLLRFIAEACDGSVVDYVGLHHSCYGERRDSGAKRMTSLQEDFFVRKSKLHAASSPVVKLGELDATSFDGRTLLPLRPYRMWRQKVHEYRIVANIDRIVEARVREGFMINKVHIKTTAVNKHADSKNKPETDGQTAQVTKILIVFLLQWKQNVWVEYVVSSTSSSEASSNSASGPTSSTSHGLKGATSGDLMARKPGGVLSREQMRSSNWSEWYVKMNVLAYGDFLRAFEDTKQRGAARKDLERETRAARLGASLAGAPSYLHDFIRNVQDVDRVLLHLLTATASANSPSDISSQFSFGTASQSVAARAEASKESSHPVFNIIGELSPVLWHRWFFVERFELLSVVKLGSCMDLFYRVDESGDGERSSALHSSRVVQPPRNFPSAHAGAGYGSGFGIGIERLKESLLGVMLKWSSQRLSRDLFLKFIPAQPSGEKAFRSKTASSPSTVPGGRRRQRAPPNIFSASQGLGGDEPEAKTSLCFVRLEFKNKTLCAFHVAFFAATSSMRRVVLHELKNALFTGISEIGSATQMATNLSFSSSNERSLVLCHRMMSRWLVTHDTLMLYDHDHDHSQQTDPSPVPDNSIASACCGGSEMQLRSVFGAYMWHSSWRWHIASPEAMLRVMRRLHEARIRSGFWVLDWKMVEDEDGQFAGVESVVFGREILMEDMAGQVKTSLLQYAIRRLSSTCLMTSFWMEPQQGVVRSRLSSQTPRKDKFHWGLKQAIGHDTPFEDLDSTRPLGGGATVEKGGLNSRNKSKDEQNSMSEEDVSIDWDDSTYLSENDLLVVIRDYVFKSDEHILSCIFTFDAIMSMRHRSDASGHHTGKNEDILGSSWKFDSEWAAANNLLLPPFSTARLLGASRRTQEQFLMYLETPHKESAHSDNADGSGRGLLSSANQHLYSMLERTLRGLSDCEVSWTDLSGASVSDDTPLEQTGPAFAGWGERGTAGQLPLWLKNRVRSSLEQDVGKEVLSKGKCFAKVTGENSVLLAFLPSLDSLQVHTKRADEPKTTFAEEKTNTIREEYLEAKGADSSTLKQFSAMMAEQSSGARPPRMSVSADDIVLYQERRTSFREGYKSWRMGHYQGSRDEKRSLDRTFRKPPPTPTRGDHSFCEEISRQAAYGGDFHVLIERLGGVSGSGFFQVAFYECSLSRLHVDAVSQNESPQNRFTLSQYVIKQLFFLETRTKPREGRPATPVPRPSRKRPHGRTGAATALSPVGDAIDSSAALAATQFRKKVKRAHEHNFSRGVYISLREGAKVQHSDLIQALSSCIEVPVDVDITMLYRMMEVIQPNRRPLLLHAPPKDTDALKEELTKSFEKIFAESFVPIEVPIDGFKYYYFTGSETILNDDGFDGEGDLHELVETDDTANGHGLVETSDMDAVSDGNADAEPSRSAIASNEDLEQGEESDDAVDKSLRSVRRRVTISGAVSPLDVTAPGSHGAAVEEDAEFNKEVAVATSSFSVPFFFRFECRTVASPRDASLRENFRAANVDIQQRNRTVSYTDFRRETMAKIQNSTSTEAKQLAFEEYVASLKSVHESNGGRSVADIAERTSDALSGRVALRLVTLTLPSERAFDGDLPMHKMQFDLEGGQGSSRSATINEVSALHNFQRAVLRRARRDIKEWCSVQILSMLQSTDRITPAVGSLVQRLFDELPDNSITKATYPLDFIPGSQDTPVNAFELFKKELQSSSALHVRECNGLYFVIEKTGQAAETQCSRKSHETLNPDGFSYKIPYWAFFMVENDHVELFLHHPDRRSSSKTSFDRLEVLTKLQLGIMAVCKRVNQYLLLLQLHETRTCNGLLLPAGEVQSLSPRSPKRKDSFPNAFDYEDQRQGFFWPGQFECDLQYSAFFRLHERLASGMAMNMLCTSALEQFQVHNRRHMFVYRDRDGHVFYMKISIQNPELATASTKEDAGGTASSSATGILLQVFGVCQAGEEVTHELCRLLERKLDEATQLMLMKLLARNVKLQMSPNDLAFICPPAADPVSSVAYTLPSKVEDSASLLSYLSQTLSYAAYIRQVTNLSSLPRQAKNESLPQPTSEVLKESSVSSQSSADVDPALIHPAWFGFKGNDLAAYRSRGVFDPNFASPVFASVLGVGSPRGVEVPIKAKKVNEIANQAAYVFNLNPELRLSSGLLSRVGKGLALLKIEVIKSYVSAADGPDCLKRFEKMPVEQEGGDMKEQSADSFVVRCQLWCRGSVHIKELESIVHDFLEEAIYDYYVEVSARELEALQTKTSWDALETEKVVTKVGEVTALLDDASAVSSSMTKLELSTPVAPWDIRNVADQLDGYLSHLPTHLRPITYVKAKSDDAFKHRRRTLLEQFGGQPRAGNEPHHFLLFPQLAVSDSVDHLVESGSPPFLGTLVRRTESIQSDISDADSTRWGGHFGLFDSQGSLQLGSSTSIAQPAPLHHHAKAFAENDMILHPSPSLSAAEGASAAVGDADGPRSINLHSKRSMYYLLEISTSDGLRFWGYNLNQTFVDAITTFAARVLTWTQLREHLLRTLLLEKGGLSAPAPTGSHVVQPRALVASRGSKAKTTVYPKDSTVSFIEYRQPVIDVLKESDVVPRVLSASLLRSIEGSSLGAYLREANVHSIEVQDSHRPRSKSGASGAGGISDMTRELSSQSSQRSLQGDVSMIAGRNSVGLPGRSGSGLSVDKSAAAMRGGGGVPPQYAAGNPASMARMRGTGATNALLAARARARGGLPNRLGGPGVGATTRSSSSGENTVAPWDLPLTTSAPKAGSESGTRDQAKIGGGETTSSVSSQATDSSSTTAGSRRTTRRLSIQSLGGDGGINPGSPTNESAGTMVKHQGRKGGENAASSSWKKRMECAWGPRFVFVGATKEDANTESIRVSTVAPPSVPTIGVLTRHHKHLRPRALTGDSSQGNKKSKDQPPLPFFCNAFQSRWLEYESKSTSFSVRSNLFRSLLAMPVNEEMEEPVTREVVDQIMSCGHFVLHQRFRVAFVERWEVVSLEEEYAGDGMQESLMSARQSSMDLVNLLSYKREFVFTGNDCEVAKMYVENTVLGMCATEGESVRDMKKQIMKNIFHLRMDVAHSFYKEYSEYLCSLGFRHLRTLAAKPMPSAASVSSFVVPELSTEDGARRSRQSAIDQVAAEGEGFTEFFFYSWTEPSTDNKPRPSRRGREANEANTSFADSPSKRESDDGSYPPTLLVLQLKCDHHGVQVAVVAVSEMDLKQHAMGFQSSLAREKLPRGKQVVSGALVRAVSGWLRSHLQTRAVIYGFTVRFFQRYLLKWFREFREKDYAKPGERAKDVSTFQNIVKGIRCFLNAFPDAAVGTGAGISMAHASSARVASHSRRAAARAASSLVAAGGPSNSAPPRWSSSRRAASQQSSGSASLKGMELPPQLRDCVARTAVVELPPTPLHSNCSESILVKILLRYIACHGSRYEVLDLMQFGTPDAVVCHSPSGSFYHRPAAIIQKQPAQFAVSPEQFQGYSLVITTQSLATDFGLQAHEKNRRKDCIQLILLKSAASTRGVGNGVLSVDRTLSEAIQFTQELFRVSAQHYERDLLWSRLLYDDTTGPGAHVADSLGLPADQFRVEVGPQQLEECLRLSICTPLESIDPRLDELMKVEGVNWQELGLRLRDIYADQIREFRFEEEDATHLMLLCPDTFDLIIHLTFANPTPSGPALSRSNASYLSSEVLNNESIDDGLPSNSTSNDKSIDRSNEGGEDGSSSIGVHEEMNAISVEICRREEPINKTFTFAQRRIITEFVNSIVHWQWRSLMYD